MLLDLSVLSSYNGKDISCFGFSDGVILANAGGGQVYLLSSGMYQLNLMI